jgi:ankyrin repeat protein
MLCEAGANVNVEDRWGKRPLDDANGSKQKECVEILTEYGAKKGSSIEVDSINSLIEAAAGGDVNTVKMLLELRNLNLNEGDCKFQREPSKVTRLNFFLTFFGANSFSTDDHRTALHLAAGEGHDQIVELLLEAGAYPNSVDRWGNRPLDDAMNSKRASCMKILKAYGAKPGYSMNVEQEAVLDLLHEYATIRDGVPSLDWQDVKDLLKGIGHEPTDEVVKKLFEVADQCGSGIINTERFMEHSDTFLGGRPARIILVVGECIKPCCLSAVVTIPWPHAFPFLQEDLDRERVSCAKDWRKNVGWCTCPPGRCCEMRSRKVRC